jgi:tRNA threonylcarbamoyladenosine biosynthesis protein TsaE
MKRLGAALARVLGPGDTVLLGGDLGAGKTTFTQGLASALGVSGPVTSPTFVLLHSYPTSAGWALLHADVWRLDQLQEVIDLAIPELLEDGAVAVVEWGEQAAPALAADCLHVAIDFVVAGPPSAPAPDVLTATPGTTPATPGTTPATPGTTPPAPDAGGTRRVVFRPLGPSWDRRMAALASAVGT